MGGMDLWTSFGALLHYSPLRFANVHLERNFLDDYQRNAVSGGLLHIGTMASVSIVNILRWVKEPNKMDGLGPLTTAVGCLIFAALLMRLWLSNRGLLVKHWQVLCGLSQLSCMFLNLQDRRPNTVNQLVPSLFFRRLCEYMHSTLAVMLLTMPVFARLYFVPNLATSLTMLLYISANNSQLCDTVLRRRSAAEDMAMFSRVTLRILNWTQVCLMPVQPVQYVDPALKDAPCEATAGVIQVTAVIISAMTLLLREAMLRRAFLKRKAHLLGLLNDARSFALEFSRRLGASCVHVVVAACWFSCTLYQVVFIFNGMYDI